MVNGLVSLTINYLDFSFQIPYGPINIWNSYNIKFGHINGRDFIYLGEWTTINLVNDPLSYLWHHYFFDSPWSLYLDPSSSALE